MQTEKIKYDIQGGLAEGFIAWEKSSNKKPVVIIAHDWTGRNSFACEKAEQLAKLGYVGFALDMYGSAKCGDTNDEKTKLIQPLMQNRQLLLERILAGLHTAQQLEIVDKNKTAAIGFCFGGLCILDLARSGISIGGVVSFHGLLNPPENLPAHKIKAKVLALHGHDDPMASQELVLAFQKEMTEKSADWEMDIYGNTMHSFTNPQANDPALGTVYNAKADKRSWFAMKEFLGEIFSF